MFLYIYNRTRVSLIPFVQTARYFDWLILIFKFSSFITFIIKIIASCFQPILAFNFPSTLQQKSEYGSWVLLLLTKFAIFILNYAYLIKIWCKLMSKQYQHQNAYCLVGPSVHLNQWYSKTLNGYFILRYNSNYRVHII